MDNEMEGRDFTCTAIDRARRLLWRVFRNEGDPGDVIGLLDTLEEIRGDNIALRRRVMRAEAELARLQCEALELWVARQSRLDRGVSDV